MSNADEAPQKGERWGRFDWLWNSLAVLALALAASFLVNIYRAVSIDGITITETFATIVQGVGVAILSGGVLTSIGQAKITGPLNDLRIHPRFHGMVIFSCSALLLLAMAAIQSTLDDHYFNEGARRYQEGDLGGAAASYLQGLQLNPDAPTRRNELGEVYESLGEFAEATKYYHAGAEKGDPLSLNSLGRVAVREESQLAEAYLLLGLQRMETQEEPDINLLYQLHRNLGWALIQQQKYALAESFLVQAIDFDQNLPEKRKGGGMAPCFLAQNYTLWGKPEQADPLWRSCLAKAQPEFIHEYQWFLEIGRGDVAYCLDSSQVVGGFEGVRGADVAERCGELFRPTK